MQHQCRLEALLMQKLHLPKSHPFSNNGFVVYKRRLDWLRLDVYYPSGMLQTGDEAREMVTESNADGVDGIRSIADAEFFTVTVLLVSTV
jgi:hypothetical protein